jgi:hypothetical protein
MTRPPPALGAYADPTVGGQQPTAPRLHRRLCPAIGPPSQLLAASAQTPWHEEMECAAVSNEPPLSGQMNSPAAREDWSEIARWYDEMVAAGSGPHETAPACLLRLVPRLSAAGRGTTTECLPPT